MYRTIPSKLQSSEFTMHFNSSKSTSQHKQHADGPLANPLATNSLSTAKNTPLGAIMKSSQ
eukprot:scaffold177995_cov20-Prasinocladus_malaysianus.AAC.1